MRAAHVRCRLIGAGMQYERRLVSEPHREIGIQIQRAGQAGRWPSAVMLELDTTGALAACLMGWQRLHISSTPSF